MSLQIEHKTEKGVILFVKAPDESKDFKYFDDEMPYLSFWIKYMNGWLTDRHYLKAVNGFKLIGLTSEVTEKQAKTMVDECSEFDFNGIAFNDYQSTSIHDTALDSFKSLMQYLQAYEINPLGEKPKFQYDFPEDGPTDSMLRSAEEDFDFKSIEWNKAESRTGKYIVLFKPND